MKFSICIPAYKAKFLRDCIDSILNQSLKNFELIILNDLSPEPVEEIVKSYADVRIRYFKNSKNVGALNLVDNWNKCLEIATGEFIVIMGDDDKLEPNYLEEFENLIVSYPTLDVYHCRSKIIDDNGGDIILTPALPNFESIYDNIWHRITERRLQYISDFLYRTETLRKNGGFYNIPLAWGSDDISSYIACGDKGIAHTNLPVFNYRSNGLSISSTGNIYDKVVAYDIYTKWIDSFLQNPPKDRSDLVIYNDLKRNYIKYLRKKQINMISSQLKKNPLKRGMQFLLNKRKIRLSYKEIFYKIIVNFKNSKMD